MSTPVSTSCARCEHAAHERWCEVTVVEEFGEYECPCGGRRESLRRALIELATAVRNYDKTTGDPDVELSQTNEQVYTRMWDSMLDAEHEAGLWDGDRMGEGYVGGSREAAVAAALAEDGA